MPEQIILIAIYLSAHLAQWQIKQILCALIAAVANHTDFILTLALFEKVTNEN